MPEWLYIAGGVLTGAGLMWQHLRRVDAAARAAQRQAEREKQALAETAQSAAEEARYYARRLTGYELERARTEGFTDGYTCGKEEWRNADGLKRFAEKLSAGEAATILYTQRRRG